MGSGAHALLDVLPPFFLPNVKEFMSVEKHHFQAEIQQLLNIVIHSLYTDKEIFIRELISNAADASEKFRFLQASGKQVYQPDLPLKITIKTDEAANTSK